MGYIELCRGGADGCVVGMEVFPAISIDQNAGNIRLAESIRGTCLCTVPIQVPIYLREPG